MRSWLVAGALLLACKAEAAPCSVQTVPQTVVQDALRRAAQPPRPLPVPQQPSRWWVLVPAHVQLTARDGVRQSLGYVDLASGLVSERTAMLADRGLSLQLDWDLRPLWQRPERAQLPSVEQRLEQRLTAQLRLEQLTSRLASHWQALRKAEAAAMSLQAGEALCVEVQADAEAASLALYGVVANLLVQP